MPGTKFQKLVFSIMSVILSVVLFVTYNIAIENVGMSNKVFLEIPEAGLIIVKECICAFLVYTFIASPLSFKLAFRMINPSEEKPYIVKIVIISCTVLIMCPIMSFISLLIIHGLSSELIAQWMQKIVFNFPFAFFTQIFFVQPVVRVTFRKIFKKQIKRKAQEVC